MTTPGWNSDLTLILTHRIPPQEHVQTVGGVLQLQLHQKDESHQFHAKC